MYIMWNKVQQARKKNYLLAEVVNELLNKPNRHLESIPTSFGESEM